MTLPSRHVTLRTRLFLLAALTVWIAQPAAAQVPQTIAYQGYLTDAEGAPIDEASATLTFRLWPELIQNGLLNVWTETQSDVTISGGVFSVRLGSVESLSEVDFSEPLWLGVAVGDATADELEPRTPLDAVPYSLRAQNSLYADTSFHAQGIALPLSTEVESSDTDAFEITNTGTRGTAKFVIDNPSNFNSPIQASTNGIGAGIYALSFGSGRAGLFHISNNANTNPAVEALSSSSTAGSVALVANHSGSQPDSDIARFQDNGSNVARIAKDGTGFFNGGVQSSGADVAEAFDVEGARASYEPGDVLVISTDNDRRVTRTSEPYSALVVGVFATKPGVLLSEHGIDEDLGEQVPMGVVGVIPTKVTAENGPIRRGDLLVTSSREGHAMKGTDRDRMLGAVIGKALENFDGPGAGLIKVMVNVQ